VEGEPLVDIEAIERRLIGYTSSQAGLVVQDCWHLASALRSARRERDEARAEVERLRRLWAMCDARSDHDARCFTVTTATPYPKPDAEGCDCGLRALWTAMEAK
jgi:hypothetical protein